MRQNQIKCESAVRERVRASEITQDVKKIFLSCTQNLHCVENFSKETRISHLAVNQIQPKNVKSDMFAKNQMMHQQAGLIT